MTNLHEAGGLLTERAEQQLADSLSVSPALDEVRDAPNYVGGLVAVSRLLPNLITREFVHHVAGLARAAGVDAQSEAAYTASLAEHAYQAVRQDLHHDIFLKLAELTTGAVMAKGDEQRTKHGLELGRRIIVQRAHRTAYYLADSAKSAQTYVALYDEPAGDYILTRASRAYGKNGISPLHTTQKADGRRFQRLIDRIQEEDHSLIEDKLATVALTSGRFGRAVKWTRLVRQLQKPASKPGSVDKALEEVFDTFYPTWNLGISEEDVLFIARFTSKVSRLLDGAARRDTEIAKDPRQRHLSVLTNRLVSWNIRKNIIAFEEGASLASTKEPT